MRKVLILLLFASMALAATDLSIDQALGNATSPFMASVGSPALLGILAAAALAYMAWRKQLSLPAIFIAATFVMAIMAQYAFISREWVYAALILGGIIAGVGIARWLGLFR
jgi:hypothetical protein